MLSKQDFIEYVKNYGWEIRWFSTLPHNISEMDTEAFFWSTDEDMICFSQKGAFLDVGWYGSQKEGTYRGVFVLRNDWQNPLAEFRTRDDKEMMDWLTKQVTVAKMFLDYTTES